MSFPPPATQLLRDGTSQHELLFASSMTASNLSTAAPDPQLPTADIVFGQPDPDTIKTASRVRWTHLTSAGYERYDRADLREASAKGPRDGSVRCREGRAAVGWGDRLDGGRA